MQAEVPGKVMEVDRRNTVVFQVDTPSDSVSQEARMEAQEDQGAAGDMTGD